MSTDAYSHEDDNEVKTEAEAELEQATDRLVLTHGL